MIRSVLPETYSTTIVDQAVLCVADPFQWTLTESATFRLRICMDLGVVTLPSGTAGTANVSCNFWVQAQGTGAPTDIFATPPDFTWGIRSVVRNATYATSFALGAGLIDQDLTLAADDWEMYVGIGVDNDLSLASASVNGYTPSGFIDLYGFAVNF